LKQEETVAKHQELAAGELRWACKPGVFKFRNTARVPPLEEVIGQERAVRAIEFGLNMNSCGYNIFVTGREGTGKSTIVQDLVRRHARSQATPCDWCLVNNFQDEFCPRPIALAAAKAGTFKKQMARLVSDLKTRLPKALAADSFQEQVGRLREKYGLRQQRIFATLDRTAESLGLHIDKTQSGFKTIALVEGKPMTREQFEALPAAQQKRIEKNMARLQGDIEAAIRQSAELAQTLEVDIEKLTAEAALFVVRGRIDILKRSYGDWPDVIAYLDEVQQDMVENVERFVSEGGADAGATRRSDASEGDPLRAYQVNVLVDRRGRKGAPVIFETNPTYRNVFGHIEKRAYLGTLTTDFTMVQAGALLRANGGYLIMEMASVLLNPLVWEALKRALQNKLLHIEDMGAQAGFGTTSLRPEPIALDVKVVLLGSYPLFRRIQDVDAKFNKIFRVRADFDDEVDRSDETVQQYARFVSRVCRTEGLLPLTARGVAAVVEIGEKQVAHQERLSLRFGPIFGLLKEADYWARRAGARSVSDRHVRKAFEEHRFRYNLYEEKMQRDVVEGTVMIDVTGRTVGQVNALAVYQIGSFSFGRPSRITAVTFMGKKGVINIERESHLSGKTHDKGVLILSGYLGRVFAQNYPLNLSISITFEQSYGGIDGDSASSTELYAILSSLSQVPIRQGIAVTGSVNQNGRIQAIGGVNQKIEGFFDICRARGLNGRQGVIIPAANVKNLMLKKSVVAAVRKRKFHVYPVAAVEEGIEILTGMPAGSADDRGNFPPESVYGLAQARICHYIRRSYHLKDEFSDRPET
jgi:lon-related putative ATP-dependent protease